jgi:hypothetical protein
MNMATKRDIFEEHLEEWLKIKNDRKKRGVMGREIARIAKVHPKSVPRSFKRVQLCDQGNVPRRGRPRYYGNDVIAALKDVWEIGSEACGENLHPMIREYIDTQLCAGDWPHGDEATGKLRAMSLGSVKRYVGGFMRTRRSFGGKGTTEKSSVMSMVPIRMDGWDEAEAGVTQIDTVAHCGDSVAGDFIYTVNSTDVATLWGTRRAQWNKGGEATKGSIDAMRRESPFPWTELHPDSGTEFINHNLLQYALTTGIRLTRSRPYHKNDNRFVEERNGHIVRAYVGWQRLDVREAVAALNDLYDVLTPYLNHFIASRRIVSKQRIGARWKVVREKVGKTPYQRVLARDDISEEVKAALRRKHAQLNPRAMKVAIDRLIKRVIDVQKRYGRPKKSRR